MGDNKVAKDIMFADFLLVTPEMAAGDAVLLMLKKKAHIAFVVSAEGKLVGVFTEHDAIRPLVDYIFFEGREGLVKDYLSEQVSGIGPHDDLLSVANQFLVSRYKILPVVKDDEVVGYITRQKLILALSQEWTKKSTTARGHQEPMVGRWANRFRSGGGSALPDGFSNHIAGKDDDPKE